MSELVTIYIPTFNRVYMLRRALDSVLRQSYQNIEVIIVDDGSSDGTKEYLESLRSEKVRFFINKENSGPCYSRNKAIFSAAGKYVTGLDDDDEFETDHIENLVYSFNERYSFVTSSMVEVGKSGRIIRNNNVGVHNLESLLHYNKLTNQAFTLTERMQAVGAFDLKLPAMQDYDTWLRLVERFGPALKTDKASYICHTDHESDRISRSLNKRREALDIFYDKYKDKMNESSRNSYCLLRRHMLGEKLGFTEFLKRVNNNNWRMAVALYLNSNGFIVKSVYDMLRSRSRL